MLDISGTRPISCLEPIRRATGAECVTVHAVPAAASLLGDSVQAVAQLVLWILIPTVIYAEIGLINSVNVQFEDVNEEWEWESFVTNAG